MWRRACEGESQTPQLFRSLCEVTWGRVDELEAKECWDGKGREEKIELFFAYRVLKRQSSGEKAESNLRLSPKGTV